MHGYKTNMVNNLLKFCRCLGRCFQGDLNCLFKNKSNNHNIIIEDDGQYARRIMDINKR